MATLTAGVRIIEVKGEFMWPFRSKKQIEALKEIPVLNKSIEVSTALKIASVQINFNVSQREPYWASIEYKEKPEQWQDLDNQSRNVELKANSWQELIDKVVAHFAE